MVWAGPLSARSSQHAATRPILVVAGPTASGKSELALRLAQALNGEIISLDSVQLYRGLDIGSAKLPLATRQVIPHHLVDIKTPDEPSNVAEFIAAAHGSILQVQERGRLAVLAGGSTLYLTCLLHGLAPLPRGSAKLRQAISQLSNQELYEQLCARDAAAAARFHPHDRLRIVRALESISQADRPYSEMIDEHGFKQQYYQALILVLVPAREALYAAIDRRAKEMVSSGLIDEAARILERYGERVAAFRMIGYAQALQCLKGELAPEQLASEIAQATRRLAKRQLTFWRNEPAKRGWRVVPPQEPLGDRLSKHPKRREIASQQPTFNQLLSGVKRELSGELEENRVWFIDLSPTEPRGK